MSQDKAVNQGFKPRSDSPKLGFFPLLRTASQPAACPLPPSHRANSQTLRGLEKVGKHCSGQSLQGLSTVSSFLSRSYCGASSTSSRPPPPPGLFHSSCGLTAPISTLSHTLQDLSFLNLSQNVISQGHSPTLKGKVPWGKEIKLA